MSKGELIRIALKHYRETVLQKAVIDITIDEYTPNKRDRESLVDTLKEYANIDRITAKIEDADKLLSNTCSAVRVPAGHNPTDDEYNEFIDKYNELYFALIDVIR